MSFKQKPNKLKYLTTTKTLDEIHKEYMSKLDSNYKKLEYISKTSDLIINYYDKISGSHYDQDEIEVVNIENINKNIDNDKNIIDIENNSGVNYNDDCCNKDKEEDNDDYISINPSEKLKMLNLLSQKNRKAKKPIKKRKKNNNEHTTKSIFHFFQEDTFKDENESENENKNNTNNKENNDDDNIDQNNNLYNLSNSEINKLNRAELQDKFLFMIDKNYACNKIKYTKNKYCITCDIEKTFLPSEGRYVCKNCGETEHVVIEMENNNNKEIVSEKQKYPYKKINHLKEKLNQFQSKETADVSNEIYEKIYSELKKKRINFENATPSDIKNILKENRLTNYYEHLQQIYCKITNCQPIVLSRETEETIISMFQSMQEPFQKYRPNDRSNFLSYSYVLNKLFKIIGLETHSNFFYLLKSKDKLRDQDNIWAKICKDMGWKFFSSF